jgi:hypothetical protein
MRTWITVQCATDGKPPAKIRQNSMRTEEDGRSGERHFDSKAAQIKYAAGRRKGGSDQIRRRPEGRIWSNTLPAGRADLSNTLLAAGRAVLIKYAAGKRKGGTDHTRRRQKEGRNWSYTPPAGMAGGPAARSSLSRLASDWRTASSPSSSGRFCCWVSHVGASLTAS